MIDMIGVIGMTGRVSLVCLLLVGCTAGERKERKKLTLYCSAPIQWCELVKRRFFEATGIRVAMSRKSSGETYAQVWAEKRSPPGRCLVWRHRGQPSAGRRTEPDAALHLADAEEAPALGARPGRSRRSSDDGAIPGRFGLQLQHRVAPEARTQGARGLAGSASARVQGGGPDGQPQLLRDRVHCPRDRCAALWRGGGL